MQANDQCLYEYILDIVESKASEDYTKCVFENKSDGMRDYNTTLLVVELIRDLAKTLTDNNQ